MSTKINTKPAEGWVGGFAQENEKFAYPDPDLSSLDLLDNMDNIDLLDRQQKVIWPEFSWLSVVGDEDTRCYQMFAPDISRIGYTNKGRVYSIICPQQGATSPKLGSMNVEVTVTGQRGWVDETAKTMAADMRVEGTIWFSAGAQQRPFVKLLWFLFKTNKHPFPSSKASAIKVTTHLINDSSQKTFPLNKGETTRFPIPEFARHKEEAWDVANLDVQIGPIVSTGDEEADKFNNLIMDAFNIASGNMLKSGNVLSWNVWFTAPELVDRDEWKNHAKLWRESIDADHGSPDGEGTDAKYFDGKKFKPVDSLLKEEYQVIIKYIKDHFFKKGQKTTTKFSLIFRILKTVVMHYVLRR